LRGKKVGTRGAHPSLNDWLYLKQHGLDADRGDIEFINQTKLKKGEMEAADPEKKAKAPPLWHWVRDGVVDAALLGPPASLFAGAAGLKVIDVEPLAMIQFSTISSSLPFVDKHPDIVESFLKGMVEGIHAFKTNPERSIKIIQERFTKHGQLNFEQAALTYKSIASVLEPKLYPKMLAIANVYEEAVRQDKDATKVNPMELWDLHHLRRLDDGGFMDDLYAGHSRHTHPHGHEQVKPHNQVHAAHAHGETDLSGVDHTECDICNPS
jgi:ABC-type nitrate/sulfonate/bicarbonate transport system substrate-binding protein